MTLTVHIQDIMTVNEMIIEAQLDYIGLRGRAELIETLVGLMVFMEYHRKIFNFCLVGNFLAVIFLDGILVDKKCWSRSHE